MNKVINDLYVQSLQADNEQVTVDPVKFAQLVAEECVKQLFIDECLYNQLAYDQYNARVKAIRKQFGIEAT